MSELKHQAEFEAAFNGKYQLTADRFGHYINALTWRSYIVFVRAMDLNAERLDELREKAKRLDAVIAGLEDMPVNAAYITRRSYVQRLLKKARGER